MPLGRGDGGCSTGKGTGNQFCGCDWHVCPPILNREICRGLPTTSGMGQRTTGPKGGEGSIKAPFCQPPHWTFFTLRPQTAMHKGNAASLQDIGAYLDSALNNAHPGKSLFG